MVLIRVEDPTKTIHLTGILADKYNWLTAQLGQHLQPIEEALNSMIDGDRIHTAGWMPGGDWTGTPFQAIRCHGRCNFLNAAQMVCDPLASYAKQADDATLLYRPVKPMSALPDHEAAPAPSKNHLSHVD